MTEIQTQNQTAEVQDTLEEISAADLLNLELPEQEWEIEKILPRGITTISAPPKYYKSFLALDAAIEICNGGSFFGYKCHQTGVIYFDLESGKRRPKGRLEAILQGREKPKNLYFVTRENNKIKRIGSGFEQQLNAKLDKHPEVKLIVIDVWGKIKPSAKKGLDAKEADDLAFEPIVEIANKRNISIILITHGRKMKDQSDVFANISGSYGIVGSSDTVWVIEKQNRSDEEATLYITGRDVESQELSIRFDKSKLRWGYLGNAEDLREQQKILEFCENPIRKTILALLKQSNGTYEGTASDIIAASRYLNNGIHAIHKDKATVGKFFRENEALFMFVDRVSISDGRKAKSRTLIFTCH